MITKTFNMKSPLKHLVILISLITIILMIVSCGFNKKLNTIESTSVKNQEIKKNIELKQLNMMGASLLNGSNGEIFKDAFRSFEFQNQEIQLNINSSAEVYDSFYDENSKENFIAENVTSINPHWDIINIESDFNYISTYLNDNNWAKNTLVDFSQIPEFRANTKPEILNEQYKNEWGGIIPGPAIKGEYFCLYYNKTIAEEIGIKIKSKNMSLNDFTSYIYALSKFNDKNPQSKYKPFFETFNENKTSIFSMQLFASLFTDTENFLKEHFNENKLSKWFEVLLTLEDLSAYNLIDANNSSFNELFLDNNYLFYVASSSDYCKLDKSTSPYYLAELPGINSSIIYPLHYSVTWAVPKNAPNKEEAIKFLLHLNSSEIGEQWVNNTMCPTGINCNSTKSDFENNFQQDFSMYLSSKFKNHSYKTKNNNAYIFGSNLSNVNSYEIDVLSGKMTASEAQNKILNEIKLVQQLLSSK